MANPALLAVSDLVNVTVAISPLAAGMKNFGIPLILGDSNIIDVGQRYRIYSTLTQVTADFPSTAPEFLAAELHFSQEPQPSILYIGRWARTATAGMLHGYAVPTTYQQISNWTSITNGSFYIQIDGVPYAVQGCNFTNIVTMNGVAAIVQTQLQAAGATNATCVWQSGAYANFTITSGTTGVNSSVGYGTTATAFGNASFSGQPLPNDTLTLGGTALTFVSGSPTTNQVQIGSTLAATLLNLETAINASTDTNISKITAQFSNANAAAGGSPIYFIYKTTGATGNAFSLARSSSAITLSGSNLSGGTVGTDISGSTLLNISAASNALTPIAGIAAETALQAVVQLTQSTSQWYCLEWASSVFPSTADYVSVAGYVEGLTGFIQGITSQDANSLVIAYQGDLGSQLQALGYNKTMVQYSSTSPYANASLFARISTVNFEAADTTITLMWKVEPGVAPENLTETQAAALKQKDINVFVEYGNDTSIIQWGQMSGGWYIDERVGLDWLQNSVQVAGFNALYTTTTKIPQTDAGTNAFINALTIPMEQSVTNGLIARGLLWYGPTIGPVITGTVLPHGYTFIAPLVNTQARADRAARKMVPIQILGTLAGAVHTANIAITVVR